MKRSSQIAAARLLGSALGMTLRAMRKPLLALPGVLGAAAVAVGCGEVAQRVFGRGLGWPAGLVVAGVFALLFGREINQPPPAPRREDDGL